MQKVFNILKENNLTVSFAESITGGSLSYDLVKIPGSSNVFMGSIVAYSKQVKIDILKVGKNLLNIFSVVSEEISNSMAIGLSKVIKSDLYVSVTGNAGPSLEPNTLNYEAFYTIIWDNNIESFHLMFETNNREDNINLLKQAISNDLYEFINERKV